MADVKFSVSLKGRQAVFWERKKRELAQMDILQGKEETITNTTMFQAMVDLWMTLDGKEK